MRGVTPPAGMSSNGSRSRVVDGGGGGGGFLASKADICIVGSVARLAGGTEASAALSTTGRNEGLAVTEAAGEPPRDRGGGRGGGFLIDEFCFKSDEEAAERRALVLIGELDRWSLLDIARGRGLPGSGASKSLLAENLWTVMMGDESTASLSNLDRKLLTAGLGVSSTSGGESESIAAKEKA